MRTRHSDYAQGLRLQFVIQRSARPLVFVHVRDIGGCRKDERAVMATRAPSAAPTSGGQIEGGQGVGGLLHLVADGLARVKTVHMQFSVVCGRVSECRPTST
jgi:hypothetical protein